MESKKKDLEIICNLQWKNQPANGGDKSNIIGMYDIPGTTLNWDVFKSYLFKNSGTDLDDVRVFYVTSNDREFPIESQTDFQIALYAFRRKARNNEIINLKLERVNKKDQKSTQKNKSIDVETQSDTVDTSIKVEDIMEGPPAWFTHFMTQFKQDILTDVKTIVTESVTNIQPAPSEPIAPSLPLPYPHSSRKSKSDAKRLRKCTLPGYCDRQQTERELAKSQKQERKLECKLEKLENKSKKLKEKKLALLSKSTSDSDGGPTCSNKRFERKRIYPNLQKFTDLRQQTEAEEKENESGNQEEPTFDMDALVLTKERPLFFRGGEVFAGTWTVKNNGRKPWNSDTYAIFTWGSKALQPEYRIPCPKLNPGETGKIRIVFDIPCQQGKYECYYHFHQKDRRFGQCLSCLFYVDPLGEQEMLHRQKAEEIKEEEKKVEETKEWPLDMEKLKVTIDAALKDHIFVKNAAIKKEAYCTSDSDNQSDGSESDEGSKDEFVVVPVPDCFKVEQNNSQSVETAKLLKEALEKSQQEEASSSTASSNCYRVDSCDLFVDWPKEDAKTENIEKQGEVKEDDNFDDNNNTESRASSIEQSNTVVIVTDNTEDGYAYVEVNGKGLHVPSKILKSEYVEKKLEDKSKTPSTISIASSSVVVINDDDDLRTEQQVEDIPVQDEMDLCGQLNQSLKLEPSAPQEPLNILSTSAHSSNRIFVFPQGVAGFEVPPTVPKKEEVKVADAMAEQSAPACAPNNTGNPFTNYHQHVPNYQQTPIDLRMAPDPEVMRLIHNAEFEQPQTTPQTVHILPETLVSGAVNVASSAINTARSVINMIVPPRPPWVAEDWPSNNAESQHDENLRALAEMGFWDQELNATLLTRHKNDLSRVVADLVQ